MSELYVQNKQIRKTLKKQRFLNNSGINIENLIANQRKFSKLSNENKQPHRIMNQLYLSLDESKLEVANTIMRASFFHGFFFSLKQG